MRWQTERVVASFKTTLNVRVRLLLAVARHTERKSRRTHFSLRHTDIVTGIHAGITQMWHLTLL